MRYHVTLPFVVVLFPWILTLLAVQRALLVATASQDCTRTFSSTRQPLQLPDAELYSGVGAMHEASDTMFLATTHNRIVSYNVVTGASFVVTLEPLLDSVASMAVDRHGLLFLSVGSRLIGLRAAKVAPGAAQALYPTVNVGSPFFIAGSGSVGTTDGSSMSARFGTMAGVCFDGMYTLFIADTNNSCVRQVDLQASTVGTFVGRCSQQAQITQTSVVSNRSAALLVAPTALVCGVPYQRLVVFCKGSTRTVFGDKVTRMGSNGSMSWSGAAVTHAAASDASWVFLISTGETCGGWWLDANTGIGTLLARDPPPPGCDRRVITLLHNYEGSSPAIRGILENSSAPLVEFHGSCVPTSGQLEAAARAAAAAATATKSNVVLAVVVVIPIVVVAALASVTALLYTTRRRMPTSPAPDSSSLPSLPPLPPAPPEFGAEVDDPAFAGTSGLEESPQMQMPSPVAMTSGDDVIYE